jgi:hypothetical protein
VNEQDVRALVREAIERHLGRPEKSPFRALASSPDPHASHGLLRVLPGSEAEDGMCVIEPRVRCNHCGFCQSYGH